MNRGLLAGALDGTNAIPAGLEDDASPAPGFAAGDPLAGERMLASLASTIDDGPRLARGC